MIAVLESDQPVASFFAPKERPASLSVPPVTGCTLLHHLPLAGRSHQLEERDAEGDVFPLAGWSVFLLMASVALVRNEE